MTSTREIVLGLCESNNIKVATLERTLDIANGTIKKWSEETKPNGETLTKLADYFGVSVDYLLDRSEDEDVDELREMLHKNPETKALLSASAKLTGDDINAVVEIIKRMNREAGLDD